MGAGYFVKQYRCEQKNQRKWQKVVKQLRYRRKNPEKLQRVKKQQKLPNMNIESELRKIVEQRRTESLGCSCNDESMGGERERICAPEDDRMRTYDRIDSEIEAQA